MKNKLTTILVASLLFGIGYISFIPSEVKSDDLPMWGVDFSYDPDPGFYKEDITFTGTAGCSDPVYWNWTFQPGSVKKYGNPVTYSWAPDWDEAPESYQVHLKVTNGSGASAGKYENAQVTISYDIYGSCSVPSPVAFGGEATIYVDVYNEYDAHICPEGYQVAVEIVTGLIIEQHVDWCETIIGPNDINPGDEEYDLTTTWYDAHPSGWYRAKAYLDTRFDDDTSDNTVYSLPFYVSRP